MAARTRSTRATRRSRGWRAIREAVSGFALSVPFLDLGAANADLGRQLDDAINAVVASSAYVLGPEVEAFEREFADYCETRFSVGVGCGLDALELGLCALGVGPGDEVVVPSYTFIATWLAVSGIGARPVPVDVQPDTCNIDPGLIPDALT